MKSEGRVVEGKKRDKIWGQFHALNEIIDNFKKKLSAAIKQKEFRE